MNQQLKLALVQFESVLKETITNTNRACAIVDEAAGNGADIVVFPELFSTGYNLRIIGEHILDLAETLDGPTITAMRAAARKNNCYVVAPIALIKELPGVPYNSAVFIDRSGEIRGVYDKVHLWALERFFFRQGSEYPVFDTEFGKVGIMICYDMGFPEVARALTLQGAELIVCPSAWCVQDMDIWHINAAARAVENTVFLGAVKRFGHEEHDLYMPGQSMVCGPRGGVVAHLEDACAGILSVDIDLAEVLKHRVASPYLRDRRADTYR